MTTHSIGGKTFWFWREGPPQLTHDRVSVHARPGADDVAIQLVGDRGEPFQSVLVGRYVSYALALADYSDMRVVLPGLGHQVVYNGINYQGVFNHRYYVLAVDMVSCKVKPRMLGPGYDYIGGAELTVRIEMVPYIA